MSAAVSRGMELNEALLFEQSHPGRVGASLPASDVPAAKAETLLGEAFAKDAPPWPELSEPEVMRHYVRLSQQNFAIDKGMYPLGSCTMKYNPKVNEWAARLPGFARLHPFAPAEMAQGTLELMFQLERSLAEICGMHAVTLHPAAGAQGELTGLMMICAYHRKQGRAPKKVLIPDTAHGTNPASCALNGLQAVSFSAGPEGTIRAADLAPLIDDNVAAVMITNPNTVGLFEAELPQIAAMVHDAGGLVYGDGANLNALLGHVRPGDLGVDVMQFNLHKTFSTPHGGGGPGCGPVAYQQKLAPFAPLPWIRHNHDNGLYYLEHDCPDSIGRLRAFHGNVGMMLRAYAYIREYGAEGLRKVAELAVLNANYLRARLSEHWHTPYNNLCMHEVVINDRHVRESGANTLDIAKRLVDYGFHAPTMYFPLVVKGAMLIEPTETESKETLDAFVEAMQNIAEEAMRDPELLKQAPHSTRLRRLDETQAARKPCLRWTDNDAR